MPFTPAHGIVALPFVRTPLIPAAIAVGAMAPDAPLFFRLGVRYWTTHDWVAGALIGLPLAFILLLIWRLLLRQAAGEFLPRWFACRLPGRWAEPGDGWWSLWGGRGARAGARWAAAALLVAALLIGIWSHILWDEFTHSGRRGGVLFPILDSEPIAGIPIATMLHWFFSITALTVIAIWLARWLRRREPAPIRRLLPDWVRIVAWLFVPASLAASAVFAYAVAGRAGLDPQRVGTPAGAAILIVMAAISLVVLVLRARETARHARDSGHLEQSGKAT